jgi:hypothetical protein
MRLPTTSEGSSMVCAVVPVNVAVVACAPVCAQHLMLTCCTVQLASVLATHVGGTIFGVGFLHHPVRGTISSYHIAGGSG